MYAKLFQQSIPSALTDDKKYPCPSLPVPVPNFSNYRDEVVFQNREYYEKPIPSASPLPFPTYSSSFSSQSPTTSPILSTETPRDPQEIDRLLPVLDCRFNLREICKQSILLEDHLSHDQKRCTDCCIKHFLALEGLCEEAVTLDRENQYHEVKDLAKKIRHLQKLWYENPEKNSHMCSQELRQLRKRFQINVFPIVFDETIPNSCSGGVCAIKK